MECENGNHDAVMVRDCQTCGAPWCCQVCCEKEEALRLANAAGATHRDGRDPSVFYKKERHQTLKAVYDGEVLTAWRWYSTYPPESAGVI